MGHKKRLLSSSGVFCLSKNHSDNRVTAFQTKRPLRPNVQRGHKSGDCVLVGYVGGHADTHADCAAGTANQSDAL